MSPVQGLFPDLEERAFAVAFVSLFMQVIAILQMPMFFGGSFSPFVALHNLVNAPLNAVLSKEEKMSVAGRKAREHVAAVASQSEGGDQVASSAGKKNKPKGKKNKRKKA